MNAEIFAEWFRRRGHHVVRTASSYWHCQASRVYQAFPYHWTVQPPEGELREVLCTNRAIGLRYSTTLDAPAGHISYHAVYDRPTYGLERLGHRTRKNVRRGLKSCTVGPLSFSRLADEGLALQLDTSDRQGRRAEFSPEAWRKLCLAAGELPGFEAWGAIVAGKLAASLITFQMGETCSILYQQCLRQYLDRNVNNALTFVVTQTMVERQGVRRIFYGLHSLDAPASMDEFKFRMGYRAKPVRQRVVFHPVVAPLVNGLSHAVVKGLLALRPGNPLLSKCEGMMRFYRQGRQPISRQLPPGQFATWILLTPPRINPADQNAVKPPNVKLEVPFHRPELGEEEVAAAAEVIRSGWLTLGPKTFEFEARFARYVAARHAIAVSSGTAALHLALNALGVKAGDEVLVPTTTFTATAEVATYFGARPVLVDVDPATMNLDPGDARRRVSPRTRAIVPVHLAGQPCALDEVHRLANEFGLEVVEDAAHALPAGYRGRRVGSTSRLTAFSFYITKPLTTGEGGMVTTDEEPLAENVRLMRLHGISRDAWRRHASQGSWHYEVLAAGFKYNMGDLQAALGLIQLAKCDQLWEARRRIAGRYHEAFSRLGSLQVPAVPADTQPAWHLYILRLHLDRLTIDRDQFIEELRQRGIGSSVHFIPLHLQPFYQQNYGYRPGDFPAAEKEYRRALSLPIYPGMRDEEVDYVIENVQALVHEHER